MKYWRFTANRKTSETLPAAHQQTTPGVAQSGNMASFSIDIMKEMGGVYAHMAKELERMESHSNGKFDILSKELERVDQDIKQIKVDINERISQSEKSIIDSVKLFIGNAIQGNNFKLIATIGALITFLVGLYSFAQDKELTNTEIGMYSMIISVLTIILGVFISKKSE